MPTTTHSVPYYSVLRSNLKSLKDKFSEVCCHGRCCAHGLSGSVPDAQSAVPSADTSLNQERTQSSGPNHASETSTPDR